MNEHLLQTIDSIDDIIEESEMNVCAALYDEYQKMSILLEYADEDVCEEMAIFQEAAAKNEKSDDKGSSKKEGVVISALKKLGGIIATLWGSFVEKIKDLVSKFGYGFKATTNSVIYKFITILHGEDSNKELFDEYIKYFKNVEDTLKRYQVSKDTSFEEFRNKAKKFKIAELEIIRDGLTAKSNPEFDKRDKKFGEYLSEINHKRHDLEKEINKIIDLLTKFNETYDKVSESAEHIDTDFVYGYTKSVINVYRSVHRIITDLEKHANELSSIDNTYVQKEIREIVSVMAEQLFLKELNNSRFKSYLKSLNISNEFLEEVDKRYKDTKLLIDELAKINLNSNSEDHYKYANNLMNKLEYYRHDYLITPAFKVYRFFDFEYRRNQNLDKVEVFFKFNHPWNAIRSDLSKLISHINNLPSVNNIGPATKITGLEEDVNKIKETLQKSWDSAPRKKFNDEDYTYFGHSHENINFVKSIFNAKGLDIPVSTLSYLNDKVFNPISQIIALMNYFYMAMKNALSKISQGVSNTSTT